MKPIKITALTLLFIIVLVNLPGAAEDANQLTPGETYSVSGYPLSLKEAIRLTLKNNFDIEIARLERKIIIYDIPIAQSIYDTTLTADVGYTVDEEEQPSTIFPKKQNLTDWNVGLSKKFSFGSLLSFNFLNRRNSAASLFATLNPYYKSDMEVSLTQPLVKNFFGLLDRGSVKLVRLDVSRLDLDVLDRVEANIADVHTKYWNLVFAYGDRDSRKEALEFAENFFKITKDQYENGAAEDTDLFAAEANVEERKRDLLRADKIISDTSDNLKLAMNFFIEFTLSPQDKPTITSIELNKETHLLKALERRRDLQSAQIAIEEKNLSIRLKKNERLPQIDLIGTFTANGLAREMIDAVGEAASMDDPTYFIGVEVSYPFENRKARSEFKQSELEKAQAIWDMKKIEKEIYVDIEKTVRHIIFKEKQGRHNEKIYDLQNKKLKGEEKKYGFGRSSSDTIIRFQDDVVNAKTGLILALTDYEKALINLKRNQNVLLDEIDWVTYEEIQE